MSGACLSVCLPVCQSGSHTFLVVTYCYVDGKAQSLEHWTANLATQVRSPAGVVLSDLICAIFSMSRLSLIGLGCQCVTAGTLERPLEIRTTQGRNKYTCRHHYPLSSGEGTSGKVLNWTVPLLNHAYNNNMFRRQHMQSSECCHYFIFGGLQFSWFSKKLQVRGFVIVWISLCD